MNQVFRLPAFLAGLTPRRVSDTRRWWAQTCGLTLTNSERGYLPIMQLPFHPSFQFWDITVLKWLLWERISATPPTMGIFHMKVTPSFVSLCCERGILSSYQPLSVTASSASKKLMTNVAAREKNMMCVPPSTWETHQDIWLYSKVMATLRRKKEERLELKISSRQR